MARVVSTTYVSYKKVSGFTPGPLKPTVSHPTSATTNTVQAWVNNKIGQDIDSLGKDESIMVIITGGDLVET